MCLCSAMRSRVERLELLVERYRETFFRTEVEERCLEVRGGWISKRKGTARLKVADECDRSVCTFNDDGEDEEEEEDDDADTCVEESIYCMMARCRLQEAEEGGIAE